MYGLVALWIRGVPFPTMFVMSFAPSPLFDVAGIAAGAARVPIRIFYPAILLGKIGRATIMAAAGLYASDFVLGLLDVLELQFGGDLLDSWG